MGPVFPAPGGSHAGPHPTDHGKLGSKPHLATDRTGIPLMHSESPADRQQPLPSGRPGVTDCVRLN